MKHIFLFLLLFCLSCGQSKETKESRVLVEKNIIQSPEVEQAKIIDNALLFINSYIDNCNKGKESIGMIEWVDSSELATQSFKNELKRIMTEAYEFDPELGLDGDPILDAQDYPDKGFELDSYDAKTNYVVVRGIDWQNFKLKIKMIKANNNWLVDGCGMINIP